MILAWLAVLSVMLVLAGLGRLVSAAAGALWWGFGLGALLLTLYATLTPWPLTPLLIALMALAVGGYALRHPTRAEMIAMLQLGVLALPLIFTWSHGQVFLWDDFAHRLPSLFFVEKFDALPNHNLPPSFSAWAAYPYALTVAGLAVCRLLGEYFEMAIALINGALTIAFAGFWAQQWAGKSKTPTFPQLAAALALVAVMNPILDASLISSAYQEMGLSLAVAVAFLLLRPFLVSDAVPNWREALQIGLVLALITGLKQVGLVLAVMLVAPFMLQLTYRLWRSKKQLALLTAMMLVPMALIWLSWRYYVAVNIGTDSDFSYLPWSAWHWSLWPQIQASLIKKSAALIPLGAFIALALWACRRGTRFYAERKSLWLASAVGVGYVLFLTITYLASFGPEEAARTISFQRYLQHIDWMLWAAFCCSMAPHIAPYVKNIWIQKLPMVALLIPLLLPQIYINQPSPEAEQMRKLAQLLPSLLPADQNLLLRVEEPESDGFRTFVLRYYVGFGYRIPHGNTLFGVGDARAIPSDAEIVLHAVDAPVTLRLCHQGHCATARPITLPTD